MAKVRKNKNMTKTKLSKEDQRYRNFIKKIVTFGYFPDGGCISVAATEELKDMVNEEIKKAKQEERVIVLNELLNAEKIRHSELTAAKKNHYEYPYTDDYSIDNIAGRLYESTLVGRDLSKQLEKLVKKD